MNTRNTSLYTEDEIRFIKRNNIITKTEELSDPTLESLFLRRAINAKKYEVAEFFITKRIKFDMPFTLKEICRAKDSPGLQFLLKHEDHLMGPDNSFLLMIIDSNNEAMVQFLLSHGVDVNHKPPQSAYYPLHKAIGGGNFAIVNALLNRGALPNAISRLGTAIDSALTFDQPEIISLLLRFGATLPTKTQRYIQHPWPLVGQIEIYDEEKKIFSQITQEMAIKIKNSEKNAAVRFFAEYENQAEPTDEKKEYSNPYQKRWYSLVPKFEGISLNYDPLHHPSTQWYKALSKHFILFRILIRSSLQMEPVLIQIKKYLGPNKQIVFLSISAHSNSKLMHLGYPLKKDPTATLHLNSASSKSTMARIFSHLSKDATIALAGCSTAKEAANIAKEFSHSAIAKGRLVFGAPKILSENHFITFRTKIKGKHEKTTCFPFFSHGETAFVATYRNSVEVARGKWPLRSKL